MIWRSYRKRKALRSYRTGLARKLRARFGAQRSYTPAQVDATARQNGFSVDYLCYAIAMYCEREAFDAYHAARGEVCDYTSMRHELDGRASGAEHGSTGCQHGAHDTTHDHDPERSTSSSWFDSLFGSSSDGGGFDSGGFDGGGDGGGGGGD